MPTRRPFASIGVLASLVDDGLTTAAAANRRMQWIPGKKVAASGTVARTTPTRVGCAFSADIEMPMGF